MKFRFPTTDLLSIGLISTGLIALAYWPVAHAGFVWDDIINFVENDWLSKGDQWKHYLFRDFNEWVNFFRPLVVGLFTIQIRLFDSQPGPMHLVSLGLHLINALLVGLLALHCRRIAQPATSRPALWLGCSILVYGLHPALIEVVAWIGCQFDLVATFFMLLGLLANTRMRVTGWRATTVSACFFLAACAKESAAVFPLMLLAFDWALQSRVSANSTLQAFTNDFFKRNALTFSAMFLAGLAYLGFRYWGLGHLVQPTPLYGGELTMLGTLQKVAYTYLQYWRMLVWPTHNMNPFHAVDTSQFEQPSLLLGLGAALAMGIPIISAYAAIRLRSAAACIVLAVTASLLTVINIFPAGFALSLYHERYIINALAMICIMLPMLQWPRHARLSRYKRMIIVTVVFGLTWLASSAFAIRSTLPLWRHDENVWRWAYAQNPDAVLIQYNLTAALIRNGKIDEAHRHVDLLFTKGDECAECAIDAANAEINRDQLPQAERLLELARQSREISRNRGLFGDYMLATGRLTLLQGKYEDSAQLSREGIRIHPKDLAGHIRLAEALSRSGQHGLASKAADDALLLATPSNREALLRWRLKLEVKASSGKP